MTQPTHIIASILTVRILYVDGFKDICGNPPAESDLFLFIAANGFNSLYLYDLNTVLQNKVGKHNLQMFIGKCHLLNIDCIAVGGSTEFLTGTAVNSRAVYQKEAIENHAAFDGLNLEKEFWRYPKPETCTVDEWINTLSDMQKYCQANNLSGSAYIGQLNDKEGKYTDSDVANKIVLNTKRLLVSNYVTTSQFLRNPIDAIADRLSKLQLQAYSVSLVLDVIIIFNCTQGYMHKYFKVNTMQDAYDEFMHMFKQKFLTGKTKTSLNIIGYACYSYQEAKSLAGFNK